MDGGGGRGRSPWTPEQLWRLNVIFYDGGLKYPTNEQANRIASTLSHSGVVSGNVRAWFAKERKKERDETKRLANVPAAVAGSAVHSVQGVTTGNVGSSSAPAQERTRVPETLALFPRGGAEDSLHGSSSSSMWFGGAAPPTPTAQKPDTEMDTELTL